MIHLHHRSTLGSFHWIPWKILVLIILIVYFLLYIHGGELPRGSWYTNTMLAYARVAHLSSELKLIRTQDEYPNPKCQSLSFAPRTKPSGCISITGVIDFNSH